MWVRLCVFRSSVLGRAFDHGVGGGELLGERSPLGRTLPSLTVQAGTTSAQPSLSELAIIPARPRLFGSPRLADVSPSYSNE